MMIIIIAKDVEIEAEVMPIFFLVGYVEKRLWWPIQSLNIGGKKKASS